LLCSEGAWEFIFNFYLFFLFFFFVLIFHVFLTVSRNFLGSFFDSSGILVLLVSWLFQSFRFFWLSSGSSANIAII